MNNEIKLTVRRYATVVIAALLIAGAVFWKNKLEARKQDEQRPAPKPTTTVYTEIVQNADIPVIIEETGRLEARDRIEIFAEVQGVFEEGDRDFKAGVRYRKGEVVLRLNSDEHFANLQSAKSTLFSKIVGVMPDLKLDFPSAAPKWEEYLESFRMDKPVPPLPEPDSEQERLFLSGREIYTFYYQVRNLQVRLGKFTITAPFDGILTEALINKGALVNPGQQLGTFIDPGILEMELPVSASYKDRIFTGQEVDLEDLRGSYRGKGRIARINQVIDPLSQTLTAFVEVPGKGLNEGMFLKARIQADTEKGVFELSRSLLNSAGEIFIVRDSLLDKVKVTPVHYKEETVLVRGLEDGVRIVARPLTGAYKDMVVRTIDADQ